MLQKYSDPMYTRLETRRFLRGLATFAAYLATAAGVLLVDTGPVSVVAALMLGWAGVRGLANR